MPSRDEDLEWLYGRDRPQSQPEPTRVLPAPLADGPVAPPAPSPYPPPDAYPPPARGPVTPPGYPAMPAYGDRSGGPAGPPPGGPIGPTGPAAAPGGRPPRSRRRHPVRTTFRVLLVLVLLAATWLIGVPAYAWSHVGRVDDAPSGSRPANQPGQTYLLVGSDSREGLTRAEQKKLGTGDVAGKRTDTIMLVHIPTSGDPALISLPRDSYLPIPGNGTNKINTAYAFGGPKLLVQTVEQNTGLRVDGYLEIGFGGFVNIIDALGGIRMCLPNAIKDRDSHLNLKKGCQVLSGVNALGYVRMRKADPRGDLGRVERQRQMLSAIAKKAATPATVANPFRYWELSNATTDGIAIGEDTSMLQVARLALAMRAISSGNGTTLTVPIADPDATTPVGSSVLWDTAKAKAMFADLAQGDTSKLDKYVE